MIPAFHSVQLHFFCQSSRSIAISLAGDASQPLLVLLDETTEDDFHRVYHMQLKQTDRFNQIDEPDAVQYYSAVRVGSSESQLASERLEPIAAKGDRTQPESNEVTDVDNFSYDEKFELLSAYLDGEVNDKERCLVVHWLKCDPEIKQSYQQQQALRSMLRSLQV